MLGEELANTIQEFTRVYYPGEIITIKKWADKFDIANETSYFFSDGVHPSQLTYELWAKDMAEFICTHWNDK